MIWKEKELSLARLEWVAPCMIVPKKGGNKWRLVIDYRYVNSVMVDDGYQMPLITDIFSALRGMVWFSIIDLNWGFWNLPLTEESVKYTGFAVPKRGVDVWKVCPFGMKVSPTHFQREIEIALDHLIREGYVQVYVDDIVISTETVSMHLEVFRKVCLALRESGFYINLNKMIPFRRKIPLLGHEISHNRIMPDPTKIQGIVDAQPPTNKDGIRSLIAAASYLRNNIPHFSEITAPLSDLTKNSFRFKWEQPQEDSFKKLKQAMVDATFLRMADFTSPFYL